MDLFWRENLVCPTEPEYIEMVNNSAFLSLSSSSHADVSTIETGGLFRIAIKLMTAAATELPARSVVLSHQSYRLLRIMA